MYLLGCVQGRTVLSQAGRIKNPTADMLLRIRYSLYNCCKKKSK